MQLLFQDQIAAREIAFMLRCEYDGCNAVALPPLYDAVAVGTAIELMGTEFCFEGDAYPIEPLILPGENINALTDEQIATRVIQRLGIRRNSGLLPD